MSDTDQKTTRPLTPQELAEHRNAQNYAALFRSVLPAWSISISRLRPSWCAGWCETLDADPEHPIDLDYIRDTWGGQSFKVVINDDLNRYVTSFRFGIDAPPRRDGRRLESPDEADRRRRREDRELELQRIHANPPAAPAPVIDPTIGSLLLESMKSATSAKEDQFGFVRDLLTKHMAKEPESRRDLKEMMELAKSMREMADLFGIGDKPEGGDMWGNAAAKILDVLDRKNQIDAAKTHPQLPSKAKRLRVIKNPGSLPQQADPVVEQAVQPTVQPKTAEIDRTSLAATLAGMSPMDAAAVTMSALSQMPPENRYQLMEMLGGGLDELDYDDDEDIEDLDESGKDTVLESGKPDEGSEAV
jgi:hypothetical protein